MNTVAATTRRVPRAAVIGIVALTAAFAALMVVRSGLVDGSSTESAPTALPSPSSSATPSKPAPTPARPKVVLLPNLPAQIAARLRFSRVAVVSLYASRARGDAAAVAAARRGARDVGAAFAAINILDEKNARALAAFGGPVDSPSVLVVRRPGRIVTQFSGPVDDRVVAQAAHNAGAGR